MIELRKQCVICEEWFTPEDVNLNPESSKDVAAFRHRTICHKPRCATLRKKRDHVNSAAYNERRFSGKTCDICGKVFFPYDYDLDMRTKPGRASWARQKRCPKASCHEEAERRLKEKHRPGPAAVDEQLENSLLVSEVISMRNSVFGPMVEAMNERYAQYRKMMGKRM